LHYRALALLFSLILGLQILTVQTSWAAPTIGPSQACPAIIWHISVQTSKPVYGVGEDIIVVWSPSISNSGQIILSGPSGTYQYNLDSLSSQSADVGTTEQKDIGFWQVQILVNGPSNCPPEGSASKTFQVEGVTTTTQTACSMGQYWNGHQCVCPSGQTWNGEHCVTIPQYQQTDVNVWALSLDLLGKDPAANAHYDLHANIFVDYHKNGQDVQENHQTPFAVYVDIAGPISLSVESPSGFACKWDHFGYGQANTCTLSINAQGHDKIVAFFTPSSPLQIALSCGPVSGNAPLTVGCRSNASGGNPPYSYLYNFGDGASSTDAYPSHTYNSPGNYEIYLTVTDSAGSRVQESLSINVTPTVQTSLSFTIRVVDANTGAPISGAQIYWGPNYAGTTDSNGNVRISGSTATDISITVRASGYHEYDNTFSINELNGQTLTVQMSIWSAPAYGYFSDGEADYSSPVLAGQNILIQFKNWGAVDLIVNWQGSSAHQCTFWVFCSQEHFTPAQQSITVPAKPTALSQGLAVNNIQVDLNTPPGAYTLKFQVCYGTCPGWFGTGSPSPETLTLDVTVLGSQAQIISTQLQSGNFIFLATLQIIAVLVFERREPRL
jgi:PKD repeat protein